jgi:hypothetical protein
VIDVTVIDVVAAAARMFLVVGFTTIVGIPRPLGKS